MPEIVLNCQNLQCPEPVIQTKRVIEAQVPDELVVVVDNEPALENVTRFLASQGYTVTNTQEPGVWFIAAHRAGGVSTPPAPADEKDPGMTHSEASAKTLIMIISPLFGSGDDELGGRLMKNFLATLPEFGKSLWRIVLLNGGVTLAATGSPVLESLKRLEDSGVSILVCGTCLEHFGLLAEKAVGQTTNMLDVVTSMQLADKVIRV